MYKLRKEDTSLYLHLKDIILSPFIEKQEYENLILKPEMSSDTSNVYQIEATTEPSPFDRGRGLTYFDADTNVDSCLVNTVTFSGTPEQSDRIVVYNNYGVVIPDTKYMVDYLDGRIIAEKGVEPTYIDYHWNYISVVDEWSAITASNPPVVVLDINGTDKTGYQLGAGKKIIRKATIHVFATSPAERNDIIEVIFDALYLNNCPLYELSEGSVLDYDGLFYGRRTTMDKTATLFSRATVSGTGNMEFNDVSSRHINLPLAMSKGTDDIMLSDLNAYRSKVTFDLVSYTNS
jgi:uncharacterized protein YlaN (UPF0358 family)